MNRLFSSSFIALTLFVLGCSDSKQSGAESLGKSIGKNVTEFAQGIGTGVDDQMKIKIELAPSLSESGISYTVAKQESAMVDSKKKTISIYFLSVHEFQGALAAKAFNAEGLEIGRASVEVDFKSDDAKYVTFEFPPEMDRQLVEVYRIDKRNTAK